MLPVPMWIMMEYVEIPPAARFVGRYLHEIYIINSYIKLSLFHQLTHFISSQVREIVAVLDLDVLYYPCPRNGPNFRPKVSQMGGKQQFPYMVRPLMHWHEAILIRWLENFKLNHHAVYGGSELLIFLCRWTQTQEFLCMNQMT